MRVLVVLLMSCLLGSTAMSASNVSKSFSLLNTNYHWSASTSLKKDARAQAILDKFSRKITSYKSLLADFTFHIENTDAGVKETQTGKLYMKGDKYRIENKDFERCSDGNSVWTFFKYGEGEGEVQVTDNSNEEGELSPQMLFSIYKKDFYPVFKQETVEDGKAVSVIDLTPKNKEIPYFKVRLFFEKATNMLVKSIVFEKSGTVFTFLLDNYKTNKVYEDSFFVMKKEAYYPKYDWVDLKD
ncbi:MAG: outer membrane lipoprotein carrier protein LolA [Chitinophagales bacterium]